MKVGGVGSRVRIAAKSVAIVCVSSFCSAASVCLRLVRGAGAIVYDQIDALHRWCLKIELFRDSCGGKARGRLCLVMGLVGDYGP